MVEGLGLDRPSGVLVARVEEKGPAAEAGLRRSDVILGVDGVTVDNPDAFGYRFATRAVGGTTSLNVLRAGRRVIVPVKLVPAPETRPRDEMRLGNRSPLAGANVFNLSPAVAEDIGVDADTDGIVIGDVQAGSAAQRVGFRKGDKILAINGVDVATTKALEAATRERKRMWEITIMRDGQVLTTAFGG